MSLKHVLITFLTFVAFDAYPQCIFRLDSICDSLESLQFKYQSVYELEDTFGLDTIVLVLDKSNEKIIDKVGSSSPVVFIVSAQTLRISDLKNIKESLVGIYCRGIIVDDTVSFPALRFISIINSSKFHFSALSNFPNLMFFRVYTAKIYDLDKIPQNLDYLVLGNNGRNKKKPLKINAILEHKGLKGLSIQGFDVKFNTVLSNRNLEELLLSEYNICDDSGSSLLGLCSNLRFVRFKCDHFPSQKIATMLDNIDCIYLDN